MTFPMMIDALGFAQQILCGRGTTAIWLAVRALTANDEAAEIVMPDVLCSTALDDVILAGAVPRFAAVAADRFTVTPESIAAAITPKTRAILVAHTFGHGVNIPAIRAVAPRIPIIEDAVQGIGGSVHGRLIGTLGDVSILSFHPTKLIDGHGGLLAFNDATMHEQVTADMASLVDDPCVAWERVRANLHTLLPGAAAEGYVAQLRATYRTLLKPFDATHDNVARIAASWRSLAERVSARNQKARLLRDRLHGLASSLPEVREGDAIWRYTVTLPSAILARRAVHALTRARLISTQLYPSLSGLLGQVPMTPFTDRFVNFWVDEPITEDYFERVATVLKDLKTLTIDKTYKLGTRI